MIEKKSIILIVDDSQLIIDKIKELLIDCKVISTIISAVTYDDAIILLRTENPDVVLLDINLPYKSGIDILKFIKENELSIKVIMMTNAVNEYHKTICKEIGADHFIDKSKEYHTLIDIIATYTSSKN